MPLRRITLVVGLILLALQAPRAQAGPVPWTYQWNARPIVLDADPLGAHRRPIGGITLTPGALSITGGSPGVAHGNANIVAVNLTAFAFAPTPNGQPYRFSDAPYSLRMTLTDTDSRRWGVLRFDGLFEGSFTDRKMDLTTRFTSAARQCLLLGHDFYTVTLHSYTPPEPPSQGGAGNISAVVSVQPLAAPEPSSLILFAAGLVCALASWMRRSLSSRRLPLFIC
jgi:hypothetical protein